MRYVQLQASDEPSRIRPAADLGVRAAVRCAVCRLSRRAAHHDAFGPLLEKRMRVTDCGTPFFPVAK
eukprot:6200248-Pleurochrysis_carterae.AAC.5